MKNLFPGYYQPNEDEFQSLWDSCIFTFDANVLLNFYRYTEETQSELFKIIDQLSDRLWLSHQSAYEFQINRISVISQQYAPYSMIQNLLEDKRKEICDRIEKTPKHHPLLDKPELIEIVNHNFEQINEHLEDLKRSHPDYLTSDSIREKIDEIFQENIGPEYSEDKLIAIYSEGEKRFKVNIPPGYKDDKKNGFEKYGDLILWFQIIDKAKEIGKPIILVTDDQKEDWWFKVDGRTIGPRPELIQEFYKNTNLSFYIYESDRFMEFSRKYLDKKVSEEAIKEIQIIRQSDLNMLNDLNKSFAELGKAMSQMYPDPLVEIKDSFEKLNEAMSIHLIAPQIDDMLSQIRKSMAYALRPPVYPGLGYDMVDNQNPDDSSEDKIDNDSQVDD